MRVTSSSYVCIHNAPQVDDRPRMVLEVKQKALALLEQRVEKGSQGREGRGNIGALII